MILRGLFGQIYSVERTRARKRWKLARPYMDRLISLSR